MAAHLAASAAPAVYIAVATPGLHAAGHLVRTDSIVVVPLDRMRDDGLPGVAEINDFLLGGATAEHYAFPALSSDLSGFPRTLIVNDEYDTLRASGEAFGEQLAAAGVDVRVVLVPGVLHGHLNLVGYPPAIETYALMAREISTL